MSRPRNRGFCMRCAMHSTCVREAPADAVSAAAPVKLAAVQLHEKESERIVLTSCGTRSPVSIDQPRANAFELANAPHERQARARVACRTVTTVL